MTLLIPKTKRVQDPDHRDPYPAEIRVDSCGRARCLQSGRMRLQKLIAADESTGCWVWTGEKNQKGYGRIKIRGRMLSAHRVSYEIYVGPIPQNLEIDHLCRNRACINPDHLEAVPHVLNIRRGNSGSHLSNRTHCPKGHPYSGENLYVSPSGARHCRNCQRIRDRTKRQNLRQAIAAGLSVKPRKRAKKERHLKFIRTLPCVVCSRLGVQQRKRTEAAHIRYADARYNKPITGMQRKPYDHWVTPLCATHHRTGAKAQHGANERRWWKQHNIDPLALALELFRLTENEVACQRVIMEMRHDQIL